MYIQRDDLSQTKDNPKNHIGFLQNPNKRYLDNRRIWACN